MKSFYVADISTTWQDFPDDASCAIIVYFEGCGHCCPGCQNLENQKRKMEHSFSYAALLRLLVHNCDKWKTNKVVFSGGDPFYYEDLDELYTMFLLISELERLGYQVCVYTGYSLARVEELYDMSSEIFTFPTFLKCGKFDALQKEQNWGKTNDCLILASKNQKFYKKNKLKTFSYTLISDDNVLYFKN